MNSKTLRLMAIVLGVTAFPSIAAQPSAEKTSLDNKSAQVETSPSPSPSSVFTPEQSKELQKLFGSFIKENPQLIKNSLEIFLAKEAAEQERKEKELARKRIQAHEKELFQNDDSSPFLGQKNASKTVVLFIDPYCGFCHNSLKDLERLVSENKDIRVSIRNVAILGEASVWATKALITAQKQGKYSVFQTALQKTKQPLDKSQLIDMAKTLDMDAELFKKQLESDEVKQTFEKNKLLADALHIIATPTLIIEDRMIQGYLPLSELRSEVILTKKEPATEEKIPEKSPKKL